MASRKEQKERLRAERIAQEEAERREASRRRRLQIGAAAAAVVIIAAVVAVVAASSGGGGGSSGSGITYHKGSVPASAQIALQDTPPPWKPDYNQLPQRIQALGLPGFSETTFHIHSWLHIYVDGKQVTVPPNIGIDEATQTISPLHTHDTTGIIHMEADQEYDFTLGQLMDVWGVKFSDNQIGSLKSKGDQKLQVYVNGQLVKDPVNVVMQEHDNIVIGYGKSGSFSTEPKLNWPQGL